MLDTRLQEGAAAGTDCLARSNTRKEGETARKRRRDFSHGHTRYSRAGRLLELPQNWAVWGTSSIVTSAVSTSGWPLRSMMEESTSLFVGEGRDGHPAAGDLDRRTDLVAVATHP